MYVVPTSAEIGVDGSTADVILAGLQVQLVQICGSTVPPRPAGAAQSDISRQARGFYGPQGLLHGIFFKS
jgi:hypothetical protein